MHKIITICKKFETNKQKAIGKVTLILKVLNLIFEAMINNLLQIFTKTKTECQFTLKQLLLICTNLLVNDSLSRLINFFSTLLRSQRKGVKKQ